MGGFYDANWQCENMTFRKPRICGIMIFETLLNLEHFYISWECVNEFLSNKKSEEHKESE